jgi:Tfp pilus assembly protein PilF
VRKLVFVGNCQMFWLHEYYRRYVAPDHNDEVTYLDPRQSPSAAQCAALQAADLLVEQRLEFSRVEYPARVTISAARHSIPQVSGRFLWPFGGQPHLLNRVAPGLPFGPYPDEIGDGFLNRMIVDKVDAATAVETYCALDVASVAGLDRRLELAIGMQRERDAATGYQFTDVIETSFRHERLFVTPNHPRLRIFRALVRQFLEHMAVRRDTIDRIERGMRASPFGRESLPVHPAVGRHFGITFATEDQRYEQRQEGHFTFREYAENYLRFAWNAELAEGIALSRGDDPNRAGELLHAGLQRSPESAAGHAAMSHVLAKQDRLAEAIAEARLAIACAPDQARHCVSLNHLLARAGNVEAAARASRAAVSADPDDAAALLLWGHTLARQGRRDEAIATLRHAYDVVLPHHELEARIRARLQEVLTYQQATDSPSP